jgi:hypothetical protein
MEGQPPCRAVLSKPLFAYPPLDGCRVVMVGSGPVTDM